MKFHVEQYLYFPFLIKILALGGNWIDIAALAASFGVFLVTKDKHTSVNDLKDLVSRLENVVKNNYNEIVELKAKLTEFDKIADDVKKLTNQNAMKEAFKGKS